ncbi:hypothetical protein Q0V21_22950 [Paenibacillus sp. 11B]|uniref:hypothetical protein n=1 Tax=unclassified Paenibacillus TaxID=185978 RepID=UPI00264B44E3|nr:hypothetical protein [Paenibacillus sp. 11B]MDN8591627.1 hypothetical protein [Paenibacillus sp. 11B]
MWSQIAEWSLLSRLSGLSSIIIFIGALYTFLRKNQFITTLTSTKIEQLFFSKEKKMILKTIYFLSQLILGFVFSVILTTVYYFIEVGEYFIQYVSIIGAFSYLLILYISLRKNSYFDKNLSRVQNIILWKFMLLVQTLCMFSLFPISVAQSILSGKVSFSPTPSDQFILTIVAATIVLGLSTLVFMIIIKFSNKKINEKFSEYDYDCFYITDKHDTSLKWFVYHLIDKENFLLGNSKIKEEAAIYRVEERKNVLTEKIHILRLKKNSNE